MDRISNLPCDVIDDIIKRLTLHEAARTSILSRGWRYKWLSIPYLVFYQSFQKKLRGRYAVASIIYQVLLFHKGSIVKFVVDASVKGTKMNSCSADEDHWLHFLSKHPIEELSLEFSNQAIQKIPNHLFSFSELKHLKLADRHLKPPPSFKGFGRLVLLNLCNVTIEYAELKSFISKCPLLEHLTLSGDTLPCLKINAPNLKSFNLDVRSECPRVCLKNTSFLEEVTIFTSVDTLSDAWHDMSEDSYINLIEFVCQLTSVKKLELNHDSFRFLGYSDFPSNIPDESLRHLSCLICHFRFEEPTVVKCGVSLIVRSTNLQRLHIIASTEIYDDDIYSIEYLQKQQELKHSLCHLKHVKFDNIPVKGSEMEFVKLILLAAAPSLVTLELKLRLKRPTKDEYMMFTSLEQQKLKHSLCHLKHVKIDNFAGLCFEMEFVKLILWAATSLVTLELKLSPNLEGPTKRGHKMFRSLLTYPRSSANAQIII